jgi:hypothetical protein
MFSVLCYLRTCVINRRQALGEYNLTHHLLLLLLLPLLLLLLLLPLLLLLLLLQLGARAGPQGVFQSCLRGCQHHAARLHLCSAVQHC